jgi:hypothetical protein
MKSNTIVLTIRSNHPTLATLSQFYTDNFTKQQPLASIIRIALDDYSKLLVKNCLSKNYSYEEALDKISNLTQKSHDGKLQKVLSIEVSSEDDVLLNDLDDVIRALESSE